MSLENVFSELLLDHSQHPRNFGKLDAPDESIEGANPLCGDEIEMHFKIAGETVKEISFTGHSCAICTASTSMFCENAEGKSLAELDELREIFHTYLRGGELNTEQLAKLGDAAALSGVGKLPARVKCAMLVYETWDVLKKRIVKGRGDEDNV